LEKKYPQKELVPIFKASSLLAFLLFACAHSPNSMDEKELGTHSTNAEVLTTWPATIGEIPTHIGFTYDSVGSFFKDYSSRIPVLEEGSMVHLFNGQRKGNQSAQFAVLDISVGDKDLQQCADAVMRMHAEHLRATNEENEIAFDYTSGDRIPYNRWKNGERPIVNGNNVSWRSCSSCDNSYASFLDYMEAIYMYAGTASLEKELLNKPMASVEAGDVLIQGGFPGHAVMVMATASNEKGEKHMLLAQSYMPAQQIHILNNPNDEDLSPWFEVKDGAIATPEWTFHSNNLKAWP